MSVPVLEVIGGGDAVAVSVVVCVVAPPVTDGVIVMITVVITVDGDGEERIVVEVMVTVVTEEAERTPVCLHVRLSSSKTHASMRSWS